MSIFKEKPKTEREKVEERRDEVLARGRKFKYPMQYAKHKLVINTIIISVVALGLMVAVGWAMLYKVQDTGDMIYRVTQIVPVPVAQVEGANVRYSDYLMVYRSNLQTSEQQGGQLGTSDDDQAVIKAYKIAALRSAVEYAYALKMGREMGLTVTDAEIDAAFNEHRKVGGVDRSEEGFLKILKDNFGMSKSEYRRMLYLSLMKAKVSQEVDAGARKLAEEVDTKLAENGGDLRAVAESLAGRVEYEETGGLIDNMNVDGGRSTKAMTMENDTVSEKFLSSNGDGYYYIKLNEKTASQVNYASLKIKFTEFDRMIEELYSGGRVKELIELEEAREV